MPSVANVGARSPGSPDHAATPCANASRATAPPRAEVQTAEDALHLDRASAPQLVRCARPCALFVRSAAIVPPQISSNQPPLAHDLVVKRAPPPNHIVRRCASGPTSCRRPIGWPPNRVVGSAGVCRCPQSEVVAPDVAADRPYTGCSHTVYGADWFRHQNCRAGLRPELLRLAKRGTNKNCR